jgi:uncharacterized membrane protein YkvA (DUF1232 family)
MGLGERWRTTARRLEREVYALYLASRDPRVPWHAKLVAAAVVAYALSPIDLIPDFVPILGYLDDLVVVPLGVLLVRRLIPPDILTECRSRAEEALRHTKPVSRAGAVLVVGVWLALAIGTLVLARRLLRPAP